MTADSVFALEVVRQLIGNTQERTAVCSCVKLKRW
jgi:hypothetical protein